MSSPSLKKDCAYKLSYKTRDGLLRFIEGYYVGRKDCFLQDGQGIHIQAFNGDGPLGWVIPECLVADVEELGHDLHLVTEDT